MARIGIRKRITIFLYRIAGQVEYIKMCRTILRSEKSDKRNSDKIFYIISGTHMEKRGLFGDIQVIMKYSNYAKIKGYIPVVDFKNVKNHMVTDEEIGKTNGWEKIFKQPTEYTLEEAIKSQNVKIVDCHGNGTRCNKESSEVPWNINFQDEDNVRYWRRVLRENIIIIPSILKKCNEHFSEYFQDEDRILGVMIRGTDYSNNHPYGHAIQPNPLDVLLKVKDVLEKYDCNKIILATEDKGIRELFKREFGDKLITLGRVCELEKDEYLYEYYRKCSIDPMDVDIPYLYNMLFLAKCTCLIAGNTSATPIVRLWKRDSGSEYEYEYIYELGNYS